jgi:hypothetical protein
MIFRDRVGGGGKVKASFTLTCPAEDRLRDVPLTLVGEMAGEVGEVGR